MKYLILLLLPLSVAAQTPKDTTLSINELFSLVEANSSRLRAAKTNAQAAEYGADAARAQRLPDINASLQLSYIGNTTMLDRDFSNAVTFESPHFGNSLYIEASQVLYGGGAINASVRLANVQKELASNDVVAARHSEQFLAVAAYLQLIQASNAAKVYEQNILLTEKLLDNMRNKRSEGLSIKNDITRYELQLAELELGLRQMRDLCHIANHQLCNVVGLDDNRLHVVPNLPNPQTATPSPMPSAENSTAIRAASLATNAATEQLNLAQSERRPKVALVAVNNFNGPYTYDVPPIDNNFNVWFVGVGVNYSLGNLYKSRKSIKQAEKAVTHSIDLREHTVEQVDNAIDEAYTLYVQSFTTLSTKQKNAQLAAENYAVIAERYNAGLAIITDMLDASNILLSAQLDEVNAQIAILLAEYKLKYLTNTL